MLHIALAVFLMFTMEG